MFTNLLKFVQLALSPRGVDFGDNVLHGDVSHVKIADSVLVQGSVIGAEGRSIGSREIRMMRSRIESNDLRD